MPGGPASSEATDCSPPPGSLGRPRQQPWQARLHRVCPPPPRQNRPPMIDLRALRPALPILIGASLMLSLATSLRQSLGLFMPPLTRQLGIPVADFTLAIAMQNLCRGLLQPVLRLGRRALEQADAAARHLHRALAGAGLVFLVTAHAGDDAGLCRAVGLPVAGRGTAGGGLGGCLGGSLGGSLGGRHLRPALAGHAGRAGLCQPPVGQLCRCLRRWADLRPPGLLHPGLAGRRGPGPGRRPGAAVVGPWPGVPRQPPPLRA